MVEKTFTLSEAMQKLPQWSKEAESEWTRYVITETGIPQSVLISYQEYMGMQETLHLLKRPDVMAQIDQGLSDISQGKKIKWDSSSDGGEVPAPAAARFQ